jgi:RNA polymerase sigma factor (sigma-70 family)
MEYRRTGMPILDLIQEGNLGLLQSLKKFDPHRGIRLSTYASWWIRAYVLRYILANWRLVRIGTTQAQRKLLYNLRKEQWRLEFELRDHEGKGRVLATLHEEVRSRTTSFGAALERSIRVQPGSQMDVALAFKLEGAEESDGTAVHWLAQRRDKDGVDVTAVRRQATASGAEQWTLTSIRLPAWAPKLAAALEKELAQ